MKIQLNENKIFYNNGKSIQEIHPFWLRERVDGEEFLDKGTQQRLFDPSTMNGEIIIKKAEIKNGFLEVNFNDGVNSKLDINKLESEFSNKDTVIKSIPKKKWDSTLKNIKNFEYKEGFFESKEMYDLLVSFYEFGFVVIKNVPTENNYIVKFANSIGSVRRTNFGEHFNVKSKSNPNDLAYTTLHLSPHTDNPYRNPVPCIQLLHCIKNDSVGGNSTLTDGFYVAKFMKKKFPKYFNFLNSIKVRFTYQDSKTILENWGETIELNTDGSIKRVRLSPRLDYVPVLKKDKLDQFYKARSLFIKLCNSKKFMIEFKLKPGDIMIMDNYRTLHGRTSYNMSVGERHLQGCYIDHDSAQSKMKFLKKNLKLYA